MFCLRQKKKELLNTLQGLQFHRQFREFLQIFDAGNISFWNNIFNLELILSCFNFISSIYSLTMVRITTEATDVCSNEYTKVRTFKESTMSHQWPRNPESARSSQYRVIREHIWSWNANSRVRDEIESGKEKERLP